MTMRWKVTVCLALTASAAAQRAPFPTTKCAVPYNEAPAQNLFVDHHCGIKGAVSAASPSMRKAADRAQNTTKNNLCATGPVTVLTLSDLAELQRQVDATHIKYGTRLTGPPLNRTVFVSDHALASGGSMHEGSIATLVAYILDSKYSPAPTSDSGESANCDAVFPTRVDIHVTLGEAPAEIGKKSPERDKILCSSVTAEVIPHLRPAAWSNEWLTNVMRLKRPVRVTGQLMFDASHLPCADGHAQGAGNPLRVSSWEIHPVYQLAVCKHDSLGDCSATDEAVWEKISTVADLPEPEPEGPE